MTAPAPASASISAERSPVWAPDTFGWQSWAPTERVLMPCALAANAASKLAGGQTRRSALAATPAAPAHIASNSEMEALRPFIFQLPAISGRMASVMSDSREVLSQAALAEPARQFQMALFEQSQAVKVSI